jgi:hypothetical protein
LKRLRRVEKIHPREDTNLLTETGCAIFSLRPMDEGRCFVVETMQTIGRLIHVCIVLGHKLPPHFRWDDIIRGVTVGRSGIRHDGVEYAVGVRLENKIEVDGHTDECKKTVVERRMREEI